MTHNNKKFKRLCEKFSAEALADEPLRTPQLVAYMSEIVRTTFAFHMWNLLDKVEEEMRNKERTAEMSKLEEG